MDRKLERIDPNDPKQTFKHESTPTNLELGPHEINRK